MPEPPGNRAVPRQHWSSSPTGFALLVFMVTAVWLLLSQGGIDTLLSFNGLFFLAAGALAVVFVLGVPFYFLQLGVGKWLYTVIGERTDPGAVKIARLAVTILMTVQMVVTFFLTQFSFGRIFT